MLGIFFSWMKVILENVYGFQHFISAYRLRQSVAKKKIEIQEYIIMPIASERKSGFGLSKWERNYLNCRYKAHRNKVAAAGPWIDCHPPPIRPHVQFKEKKALTEQRRQIIIMQENLRVLNRTAEIMSSSNCSSESEKPLTLVTKRNAHIIFQWFIHKFGKLVPWWASVNY